MLTDLKEVERSWDWLVDMDQFTLLTVSPFGDFFMRDLSGAFCLLDINLGEITYADLVGEDPARLFPIAFDMRIANGYIKSGLLPSDGQCFGYKRQLVAGGSMEVENVYVASLDEYISFMGDFHRQIQDVPDGTTVTLKVINQRLVQ